MSDHVIEPTQDESNAYALIAQKTLEHQFEHQERGRHESPELAALLTEPPAKLATMYTVTAQLAIASAFVWTRVYSNTPVIFKRDGEVIGKRNFTGTAWGAALGGGVVWTIGKMVHPDRMLGEVGFELATSPAATRMTFFKKNVGVLGALVGAGLNLQIGIVVGTAKFTRAK
ncbi:MAG: hypothetical protein AAF799_46870 [Myxococcota bacterium]